MGRLLDEGLKNILWIKDPVSSSRLGIYYRIPTTEDRIGYLRDIWDRDRGKIVENLSAARVKWGEKIFEGFTDGSFIKTIDGVKVEISCDPESPKFYLDWREWVLKACSDILERLCLDIFEGFDSEATQEGPPEKK